MVKIVQIFTKLYSHQKKENLDPTSFQIKKKLNIDNPHYNVVTV